MNHDHDLLTALVAAAGGIIGGIIVTYLKFRKDLESKYDIELRASRIVEYRSLWKCTGRFPKYGRPEKVTFETVQTMIGELRDWYFNGGGLFLTDDGRDAYFALQELLKTTVEDAKLPAQSDLPPAIYEAIRECGSSLRTKLVRDVGTRKEPQNKA